MAITSKTWSAGAAHDAATRSDAFAWRTYGTVLVVDDDDAVRELVADTLSRTGLEVVCAADGLAGIELFRARAHEIRAVMLDRTMPGTSGEQTLVQMRRIRPELPALLVSGYSQRVAGGSTPHGAAGFLRKPFTPESLIEQFRRMLDAA